jgi:hypothetical protein
LRLADSCRFRNACLLDRRIPIHQVSAAGQARCRLDKCSLFRKDTDHHQQGA